MRIAITVLLTLFALPAFAVCPIVTEGGVQKVTCDMMFTGEVTFDGAVDEMNKDTGMAAQAILVIAILPSAGEFVGIGTDTYEFDGSGANINVPIGVTIQATLDNLRVAINTQGTTNVLAVSDGLIWSQSVNLFSADAPGGNVVPSTGESVLTVTTMVGAGNQWNVNNMNSTGAPQATKVVRGTVVVDTVTLTFAFAIVRQKLPFTPTRLTWQAFTSTGVPKVTTATGKTVTYSPTYHVVEFDVDDGATPLVATDVIRWEVVGN